jgi:hypothetical protein
MLTAQRGVYCGGLMCIGLRDATPLQRRDDIGVQLRGKLRIARLLLGRVLPDAHITHKFAVGA